MKRNHSSLLCIIPIVSLLLLFLNCSNNNSNKVTAPLPTDPLSVMKEKVIIAADSIQMAVQSFRKKSFLRPVFVGVFTQSQYADMVGNQSDSISQSDKNMYNRILKTEGLLRPNADYFSSYDSTMSSETEGFYVPGTDSLYIILGDSATGLVFDDSVTIFHEFVHALQDQYFDLTTLDDPSSPSDEYYAVDYVIEGEAELLENYYAYKLSYGVYPSSVVPIVQQLQSDQTWADAELDSLHQAGEPLLTNMPFLWEYYSYGPMFINAMAGMNWSIIDNTIFASLPLRMLEILHPAEYSRSNEYLLNTSNLEISVPASDSIYDEDELGELLSDVMFREWNINPYLTIPDGIMADDIMIYGDRQADTLRMIWYTYWQDSSAGSNFFTNYINLVNERRNVVLPPPVGSTGYTFVNDTVNDIYIEQSKNYVFTLENYRPSELTKYISQCRSIEPYLYSSVAKVRASRSVKIPRVNKHRFLSRRYHPSLWKNSLRHALLLK